MPNILLVFVSVVYNNNFSIKYIHLKSHFFGKINCEVYNWPIGWRIVIFLVFVSVVYNNNFSMRYIHLKSHFFGKIDYEVYS